MQIGAKRAGHRHPAFGTAGAARHRGLPGTAGLAQRLAARPARHPARAAASVCMGVTLVVAAGHPVPRTAITAIPGSLSAVSANSASSAWAVGQTITATTKTLILHWHGTSWAQLPSPSPGPKDELLEAVSTVSATDAWAAGTFFPSGSERTLLLHWNGTSWTRS